MKNKTLLQNHRQQRIQLPGNSYNLTITIMKRASRWILSASRETLFYSLSASPQSTANACDSSSLGTHYLTAVYLSKPFNYKCFYGLYLLYNRSFLLDAQNFLLIVQHFLMVTQYFLLVVQCFLLVAQYFLLAVQYFLMVAQYFLLVVQCFLLVAQCFLLVVQCFLLVAQYFLLVVQYILLVVRSFLLNHLDFLQKQVKKFSPSRICISIGGQHAHPLGFVGCVKYLCAFCRVLKK
jgi:hypothetical protein